LRRVGSPRTCDMTLHLVIEIERLKKTNHKLNCLTLLYLIQNVLSLYFDAIFQLYIQSRSSQCLRHEKCSQTLQRSGRWKNYQSSGGRLVFQLMVGDDELEIMNVPRNSRINSLAHSARVFWSIFSSFCKFKINCVQVMRSTHPRFGFFSLLRFSNLIYFAQSFPQKLLNQDGIIIKVIDSNWLVIS
jgi:hypothetical protein